MGVNAGSNPACLALLYSLRRTPILESFRMKIEVEISVSESLKALFVQLFAVLGGLAIPTATCPDDETKPAKEKPKKDAAKDKPKKETAAAKKKRLAAEKAEKEKAEAKGDDTEDGKANTDSDESIDAMKEAISESTGKSKANRAKIMKMMKDEYDAERLSEIPEDQRADFIMAVGLI